MKRALPVLLIFLSGCLVQSFHPFYTDKSKVALPGLNGEWDAVTIWGDKAATNLPPWRISGNELVAYDSATPSSKIRVTFFKVGERLFCDSAADDVGDGPKLPSYLAQHLRGVHVITKIETNEDTLAFLPLDYDWLTVCLGEGKALLPYLTRAEEKNWMLFTATPADWENFLTTYGSDAKAFPTNHLYLLKRHVSAPGKEPSSH